MKISGAKWPAPLGQYGSRAKAAVPVLLDIVKNKGISEAASTSLPTVLVSRPPVLDTASSLHDVALETLKKIDPKELPGLSRRSPRRKASRNEPTGSRQRRHPFWRAGSRQRPECSPHSGRYATPLACFQAISDVSELWTSSSPSVTRVILRVHFLH